MNDLTPIGLQRQINRLSKLNTKEILYSNGPLSGKVQCCRVLGVDNSSGDIYYKDDSGNWALAISGGGDDFWSLTGNALTVAGPNFLGTTDDIDVVFKRNSLEGGRFVYNSGLAVTEFTSLAARHQTLTITSGISPSTRYGTFDPSGILAARSWILPDASGTIALTSTVWNLTGNASTVAGTNFLGTTDDIDLVLKRNSVFSGLLNDASRNTSFGVLSFNSTASGIHNSGFGYKALNTLTTGYSNAAFGSLALSNITIGIQNTAIGTLSLATTSTGDRNIALGYSAGNYNTTVSNQVFINSLDRTDYTGDQTESPIYIQQNAIVASQILTLNGSVGVNTIAPSSKVDITTNALGVAQTTSSGLALVNTTAAAAGAQQISPAIRWTGQGWKTAATAASQSVDFRAYVLPVQAISAPLSTWILESSVNGGAYFNNLTVQHGGALSVVTSITAPQTGATSTLRADGASCRIVLNGNTGGVGDVLTSAGGAATPTWTTPTPFTLTNGSGTIANGTAVDLGGTLMTDTVIGLGGGVDFEFSSGSIGYGLKLDRNFSLSSLGDINTVVNGNQLLVDDVNSLAYYDNTAHTGFFGINKIPIVALDVLGAIEVDGETSSVNNTIRTNKITSLGDVSGTTKIIIAGSTDSDTITYGAGSGHIFSVGNVTITDLAGVGTRAVLADTNGVLSAPISDISVKENIEPLNYGLKELSQLNPVSFYFKNGYKNYGERRQIGFIAQEVEEVMPDSVFTNPKDELKGYNITDMIPLLVNCIKEQQAQIEELKQLINGNNI